MQSTDNKVSDILVCVGGMNIEHTVHMAHQ